jgi:hypothetical protein
MLYALDKIMFLALTDKGVLGKGDVVNPEIQVQWITKPRIFSDCLFFAFRDDGLKGILCVL